MDSIPHIIRKHLGNILDNDIVRNFISPAVSIMNNKFRREIAH